MTWRVAELREHDKQLQMKAGCTHELGHSDIGIALVNLLGYRMLLNFSVHQDSDAVGQLEGLFPVVSDDKVVNPAFAVSPPVPRERWIVLPDQGRKAVHRAKAVASPWRWRGREPLVVAGLPITDGDGEVRIREDPRV